MPIFEYICRNCHKQFETLVTSARTPVCPDCHGQALDKQLSVFAVATRSSTPAPSVAPCGACGDPRGPGACSLN